MRLTLRPRWFDRERLPMALAAAGLAIVPTLVLFCVRSASRPAETPAAPKAYTRMASNPLIDLKPRLATPEDVAFITASHDASAKPFGPCPLVPAEGAHQGGSGSETGYDRAIASAQLTSIMAAGGAQIATINKRARKTGDEVVPGWTISQIDPKAGQVILTATDGRTVTLVLQKHRAK